MRGETLARRIHAYTFSFQSTPLMRGETRLARDLDPRKHISIHSPHARGDHGDLSVGCHAAHFNPLPSCEGRRISALTDMQWRYFNPLPSCEGRHLRAFSLPRRSNFNPLPSCEGRRLVACSRTNFEKFQSTPLMRGETITAEL